jgi:tRNA G18 (ribose-2'-O)-methylase SpoU
MTEKNQEIKQCKKTEKVLILHNIRSVLNVGAIFRTADAIRIDKIYLTGYTPAPIDRFGRERIDLAKSALGAERSVDWESFDNVLGLINLLKKEGFEFLSLEQSENSIDYKKIAKNISNKTVVVLGNETDGIDKKILEQSDKIVEIPMRGKKESLNVSVATGILLYRLFDK